MACIDRGSVAFLLKLLIFTTTVQYAFAETITASRTLCSLHSVLFPTGADAAGKAAGEQMADLHWKALEPGKPPKALDVAPMVVAKEDAPSKDLISEPEKKPGGGGSLSLSTSQWIAGFSATASIYRFHQSFTLPAEADVKSARIEVAFAADAAVVALLLNDVNIWTCEDPVMGLAPGTLAASITLPKLKERTNRLSLVVLPSGPGKPALLNVWFPVATYEAVGTACGRDSLGEPLRALTEKVVEEIKPALEAVPQSFATPTLYMVDDGSFTTPLEEEEEETGCGIPSLLPTDNASAWKVWFRALKGAAQGPWDPVVEPKAWLSLSKPSLANVLFYETTFTLAPDAILEDVSVVGRHESMLTVLAVYLNKRPVWVNPDPFSSAGAAMEEQAGRDTSTLFTIEDDWEDEGEDLEPETLWRHGRNVLSFAVLADAQADFRTAFRVNFAGLSHGGCPDKFPDREEAPHYRTTSLPEMSPATGICSAAVRTALQLDLGNVSVEFRDMAVDAVGEMMYVAWENVDGNATLSRIVLTEGQQKGLPSLGWPLATLVAPEAVAVGSNGEVYVVDEMMIKGFRRTGEVLGAWGPVEGSRGLAVFPFAGKGNETEVYVLTEDDGVVGFNTATNETVRLAGCWSVLGEATEGKGKGEEGLNIEEKCLDMPVDIAISFTETGSEAQATLWVLDQGTSTVELFTRDGVHLSTLGGEEGFLETPSVISVDSFRGLAYVMDEGLQQLVVMDRQGQVWHRMGVRDGEEDCTGISTQRFFDSMSTRGFLTPVQLDSPVEVGTPFAVARSSLLTGVRFYRASGETGEHTATLWTSQGVAFATIVFPVEKAGKEGWCLASLATPVELEAGVEYVVSLNLNRWAVGILPYFPHNNLTIATVWDGAWSALDNGEDLSSARRPVMNEAAGSFPAKSLDVYYIDVEVEAAKPTFSGGVVGTVASVFREVDAAAFPSSLFYMNHNSNSMSEQLHALRFSGYPAFMGDCAHHLAQVPQSLLADLRVALGKMKPLGITFWGGSYSLDPSKDYLAEGAALAREAGAESIGIYMGGEMPPSLLYPFNAPAWPFGSPSSLTELAKLPYYESLFANPAIKTYVINAKAVSTVGLNLKLRFDTYSAADAAKETEEFRELTSYLAETYKGSGKTFILQAWSLDHFLSDDDQKEIPPALASRAATWLKARQAGVEAGRDDVGEPASSVAIYHAVQVDRGILAKTHGETTGWAVDRILPIITTDLVGWSAYETSRSVDPASSMASGVASLNRAVRFSSTNYSLDGLRFPDPAADEIRVYLAEIGEPDAGLSGMPERAKIVIPGMTKGAVMANVPIALLWAGYDGKVSTEETEGEMAGPWTETLAGYWLRRPDGTPSFAMCYMQALQRESE
ncbi:hypothetical protein NSK_005064 [Nannochloropsis salina CCMP1776]|uniref:DUF4082 domain-containing protein n=1 Tax=Nannochloropsis salina CCMP1776 TaxID=1027361 RepID=A0A4D9D5V5_9STRA|nr:hypothetical protein NSK_005064 [Nannochloropsis salina CCMP1776]|eukprot:TFJ83969.1 hypothetical protein NSK_005064 [Nannochloropsis salina CCMP1776]